METLTINLSTILFHLFVYYVCFNILTLFIEWDEIKQNKITIKILLNPFRNFKKNDFGGYLLVMLLSLIPYLLIIWIGFEISKYTINIIW